MSIQRNRHVHTDGSEEEFIRSSAANFKSPEEAEQFGHELLQAAREWRAEIETRGPPGAPAFKTFGFTNCHGGRNTIASWIEHPWALARHSGGTSPIFLVKGEGLGFRAWIVSVKLEDGEHQWKCRYECSTMLKAHDVIHGFPYTLPDSPTLGDIDSARLLARRQSTVATASCCAPHSN